MVIVRVRVRVRVRVTSGEFGAVRRARVTASAKEIISLPSS